MNAISLLISLELDTTDFTSLSKEALIRIEKQMQMERKLNPEIPTGLVAQVLQMISLYPKELSFLLSHAYFRDLFAGTFNTISKPKHQVEDASMRQFLSQFFENELLDYINQMMVQERFFSLTVLMKHHNWLPETVLFELEKKLSIKIDFATYQIHEKGSKDAKQIDFVRKKDFYDLLTAFSSPEIDQKITMLLNITVDKYNVNTANNTLRNTLIAMTNYVAYDDTLQRVLDENKRNLRSWSSSISSEKKSGTSKGQIIMFIWIAFILIRFIVYLASSSSSKTPEMRIQENNELMEMNKVFYDNYQKNIQRNKYEFLQYLVMYDSVKQETIVHNDSLFTRNQVFTSGYSQPSIEGSSLENNIKIHNRTSYDIIILKNLYIPNKQNMPKENALIKAGDSVEIEDFPIDIASLQFYIGKKLASFESKNHKDFFQAYTQKPEWRFLEIYPYSQTTISQMFMTLGDLNFKEVKGKIVLEGKNLQKIDLDSKITRIDEFVFE